MRLDGWIQTKKRYTVASSTRAGQTLPLFGVVGLRRVRGGSASGLTSIPTKGKHDPIKVVMSQQLLFVDEVGGTVAITSHRRDNEGRYEMTRAWAPVNPYLATPRGRAEARNRDKSTSPPRLPQDLEWKDATILVDGVATPFETCRLDESIWVAVGEVPDAILSIESRGVTLASVSLARLTDHGYPPPPEPDLGDNTAPVIAALNGRFERIPFRRVRGRSDYWALRAIEYDHVDNLAQRHQLLASQRGALRRYWLERIDAHLADKMDRWDHANTAAMRRSRVARHLGHGFVFQLWFNTLGPGARTWFGNRYVGMRHHTFRIRWRP